MKIFTLISITLLLLASKPWIAFSQDEKGTHSFIIIGEKDIPVYLETINERTVEYDSVSPNHIYISEFRKEGYLRKTRYRFNGKEFSLKNFNQYYSSKELLKDGILINYSEDGFIENELIYKEEKLQQQTIYYNNGKKYLLLKYDEEVLNGEYKMWHSNGQLNFSGNYKNNMKEGDFLLFDPNGVQIKKGTYLGGNLISGEAVVQDLIYEYPEKAAQFIVGEKDFNDSLKIKSVNIEFLKYLDYEKQLMLKFTIGKTGEIMKMDHLGTLHPNELKYINSLFKDHPCFIPAMVENIPVRSYLNFYVKLTKEGLQTLRAYYHSIRNDTINNPVSSIPEEMPAFPGGEIALRQYLASNVKYPKLAQKNEIQGKVLVSFTVTQDGTIADIKIRRSVYPSLDAEAIRVIQKMPKWIPGRQKGKPVHVAYSLPINFVLE